MNYISVHCIPGEEPTYHVSENKAYLLPHLQHIVEIVNVADTVDPERLMDAMSMDEHI